MLLYGRKKDYGFIVLMATRRSIGDNKFINKPSREGSAFVIAFPVIVFICWAKKVFPRHDAVLYRGWVFSVGAASLCVERRCRW